MSSLHRPRRSSPLQWSAAVLAAAALAFLPVVVLLFGRAGPENGNEALVVYGGGVLGVAAVLAHVFLTGAPAEALLVAFVAGALNAAAAIGVFVLILVGGSCSDEGHIPVIAWAGAAVVYLAGAAWGLLARRHALWLVPVSALVAGVWLVLLSTLVTGSTGACLS